MFLYTINTDIDCTARRANDPRSPRIIPAGTCLQRSLPSGSMRGTGAKLASLRFQGAQARSIRRKLKGFTAAQTNVTSAGRGKTSLLFLPRHQAKDVLFLSGVTLALRVVRISRLENVLEYFPFLFVLE